MEKYFHDLIAEADRCYEVAAEARSKGFDPSLEVEIPQADDLASRVEKQLKELPLVNVAEIIREIAEDNDREATSLLVAKKIAREFKGSKDAALDTAVRVGLAVLTEGILVAPLDGISGVEINHSGDGDYVSIYYAGPIRSAGGTGQALSVLIADVVRRELGIGEYKATWQEVERWKEEIPLYKQAQHLQYTPTEEEIKIILENCPICIDGDGTEKEEITGFRDLPRIEGNRVRGGPCLVIAEGLCQKGSKIKKHVKKQKIDGWEFIDKIVKDEKKGAVTSIEPNYKFIKDVVGGRPVYGHPSAVGSFRLRYGRSRTAGLASISIHPSIMYILQETAAVGTQIKIERPGKAGISTPCDTLEGPLVLLKNGDFIRVSDPQDAMGLNSDIEEIVDLGEILIPFGEFLENNHVLVPGVFDIGWYRAILKSKGLEENEENLKPDIEKAFEISGKHDIQLHPDYTYFWNNLSMGDVDYLRKELSEKAEIEGGKLCMLDIKELRGILVNLGVPHWRSDDGAFEVENGLAVLKCLGLEHKDGRIRPSSSGDKNAESTLDYVASLAGVKIGDKCGTRIGARMARPEKGDMRKMNPPVHSLFGIGSSGGNQRLLSKASKASKNQAHVDSGGNSHDDVVMVDVEVRKCRDCGEEGVLAKCECGGHRLATERHELQEIYVFDMLRKAMSNLNLSMDKMPKVKGVKGMMSKNKSVEMPEKGILRAKNGVFVFKDGTCRYDATDAPLTHFRPFEIRTKAETLRKLGYKKDIHGKKLEKDDQLLELKPQDIILPLDGGEYMLKISKFIDELLVRVYGMEPFYNAKKKEDLIGAATMGLSPHTSGGMLSRLIGFTKASVGYAHPYFHAAKRRNCDGDEDCFMLLMDGLLNFSWSFLPEKRGGRMDAPLLLSTILNPNEIDKEAHNVDLMDAYPLEIYEGGLEYKDPQELEKDVDIVSGRIGTVLQYEGFGFTNDTSDIAGGPTVSSYKTLGSMEEKTKVQLELARLIRAVDQKDVAERLINGHFMPDMLGNLKSFATQTVRCTKCSTKYRRIPVKGNCYCGNKLILTVHEKGVRKYLEMSKRIAKEFDISVYTIQRLENIERAMCSLFQNEKVKDCTLFDF
ncbi:MAG: DNA polymerase II large subunit [Thermoplasmata archaeon]|nr:DNA polymerase II large subunit [Thermoplasmata archaeon]